VLHEDPTGNIFSASITVVKPDLFHSNHLSQVEYLILYLETFLECASINRIILFLKLDEKYSHQGSPRLS